jgi:Phage integrase family
MSARLQNADLPAPVRLRRQARQAAWTASRAEFPPRPAAGGWPAAGIGRAAALGMLSRPPFTLGNPGTRNMQVRGVNLVIGWLAGQPGGTWQQRWLASGAEAAGPGWKQDCATGWLDARGVRTGERMILLSIGMILAICADIVRPSLAWLAASGVSSWALARNLERARDPGGFARLRAAVDDADGLITAKARHLTVGRAAIIAAAKGGTLADIVPGDFLELLDVERQIADRPRDYSAVSWRLLQQTGVFGPHAPGTLAQLLTIGQRSPAELIDRYQLACKPVRDLLVDYLQERQPALDHRSLDTLAQQLGRNFWQDLERHHPGIASLHLPPEVATAWKQRLRTKTTAAAGAAQATGPRLTSRHTLLAVRALYLDLACWAAEDPARWGPWAVPSPVTKADVNSRKEDRRRKSRMDTRTRERLPVLPVLARSAAEHRARTAEMLHAARQAPPGGTFTVAGHAFLRVATSKPGVKIWAAGADGARRDLAWEEDHAFWTWAVIEVLRASGIRIEELLELTHHSLIQYRLPSTSELVPLLQIAPSKTDAERLLVVSPDLADVLAAVITRLAGPGGKISLTARYDGHEHVWQPPAPLLFQRRSGTELRPISTATVRNMLNAALARTGLTDAAGQPLTFTPHDFRRMFITDAILAGLPPHIAQVIAGHRDINVTLGYKAAYPEEVITHHLAFLARRRALRPTEEYRVPTDQEWQEFLGHFERRKVATGICGRAFATPCIHEHSCLRCSMHWPSPDQRHRIAEIRDNLIARIAEAEREGWLGEIEGLKISLAGAGDKLAQIDRRARTQPVDLGIPAIPESPPPRDLVRKLVRFRHDHAKCPSSENTLHRQLGILLAQPDQLRPLILTQRAVTFAATATVGLHPVPQGPGVDPQIPGHLRDRLTGLPDQPHRALSEVLVELPARLSHRRTPLL